MKPSLLTATHTIALLEVSPAAHAEIAAKLQEADYRHAFLDDGVISMHGIGITAGAAPTALLMSAENPNGAKLEDLLDQLIDEVCRKTLRLREFMKTEAFEQQTPIQQSTTCAMIYNNQEITKALRGAHDRHTQSMQLLARIGKDMGPTGQHRIGPGSVPGVTTGEVIDTTGHEDA